MISKFITQPAYSEFEQAHQAETFFKLIIGSTIIVTFSSAILSITLPQNFHRWFYGLCLFDFSILVLLFLNSKGLKRFASLLLVNIFMLMICWLAWTGGGIRANAIYDWLSLVLFVGLLIGWRESLLTALIIAFISLGLVIADYLGIVPVSTVAPTPFSIWSIFILQLGLLVLLQYLIVRNLDRAFRQTQHELILRKSTESRLQTISNNFTDGMIYQVVVDPAGSRKFTYLSDSVKKLHGITPEEGMADPNLIYGSIHPDDVALLEEIESESLKACSTLRAEIRVKDPDGKYRWSSLSSTPTKAEDGSFCFDGIELIITNRKQAEEALRQSEERFRQLYENSPLGIYRTTPDGKILLANSALIKMLGYSSFEEIAKRNLEKTGFEPSYERKQFILLIETYGEVKGLESAWICKDGSTVYVRENARIVRDPGGKTIYYNGIVEDITERKLAEEKSEKYSQKLKELNADKDKLFSIIAHDLKSPFNPLLGFSEILVNDFDTLSSDEIKKYHKAIYNSLKNEYALLENLLNWSRLETGQMEFEPEKISLYEKVETVLNLLFGNAKLKEITLVNETEKNIFVLADCNMLHSVLQNLISNAIKFTNKEGLIKISTDRVGNNLIQITVSDNGVGMRNNQIKNLFGLTVKSTKGTKQEEGTGLGLVICREMVEQQGGTISVKSEFGKGTHIIFTLPEAV
jgi:PAS domain S-box-containing protein